MPTSPAVASPTRPSIRATVSILACTDIESTVAFYVEKLGFVREWTWGEPPGDAGIRRDEIQIFFMTKPEIAARAAGNEMMLFVTGIDALYTEHRARGAPISAAIRDEPWGLREYSVRDPHGYVLRFAEGIAQAKEH
jgi:catechol 2,3-dioxygenase-like lactoylglutathione lyase family enzyme